MPTKTEIKVVIEFDKSYKGKHNACIQTCWQNDASETIHLNSNMPSLTKWLGFGAAMDPLGPNKR